MQQIVKKRTIKVSGMTCGGCEKNIENALSEIDGISEVKADRKGSVYIEYDLMKVLQGLATQDTDGP